jgi:hypothetical protein
MAQTFPNSPSTGTVYTVNNTSWKYDGSGWIRTTLSTAIPGQTGNSGKYLTTDGSNISWSTVLPSQTGNSGKYLTTDGTTSSWGTVAAAVPKITSIPITDSSYTVLDDTAVSTAGGYIKIIGTGFTTGSQVLIGTVLATSVSFISSTELRAQVPATAAGTYVVYVVATDGAVAIRINGITFSATPTWTTASNLGTYSAAISIQLAATSDSTLTYSLASGSTIPTGLSLSSSGLLSGTVTGVSADITYNFTITATDIELQDSPRTFSITLTIKDPYFPNVPLLLETAASSTRSTVALDSSTNAFTVTRNGSPSTGWISPYQTNGYWGNYFNGSTDMLNTPSSASFNFNSGAWTIEGWFYLTTISGTGYDRLITVYSSAGAQYGLLVQDSTGSLILNQFGVGSSYTVGTISVNTWTHIALVKSSAGATITGYVNGVSGGSTAAFVYPNTNCSLYFGGSPASYGQITTKGYFSNIRVVTGQALTTGNFTPPTSPLTTSTVGWTGANAASSLTGTVSFLAFQSNRFKDNSSNNFTITVTGTPQATPYWYPSTFTAPATSLGAGYFNGTTDYLTVPNNVAFELGAGDFSYEAFVYATISTNSTGQGIVSYGILGSTGASTCDMEISSTGYLQLAYATGAAATLTDPALLPLNQWVHCVVCRSGTTLSMFVNGIRKATATTSATVGTGGTMTIGGQWYAASSARQLQNGYLSSVRVLKGASAYDATQTTLTVPTALLTAIANTSLLVNFADSNFTSATNAVQNNTFIDSGNYAWPITRVGTATQGSFTPYWPNGYWSNYFNGTTDYLTTTITAAGTGSVTYECWFNTKALASGVILNSRSGNTADGIDISVNASGKIIITYQNLGLYTGGNFTIAIGTWYHLAVVRNGASGWTIYINGQIDGTFSNSVNITSTTFTVGLTPSGSSYFGGYVSNVRVANSAIYTSAFTSSTTPLTAITNTQLLTCQSNRFVDNNTQVTAKTITLNGTPQTQAFQPFSPSAPYTTAAYGGSIYNAVKTDGLSATSVAGLTTFTGDFTIDCWVYPTDTSVSSWGIIDTRTTQQTANPWVWYLVGYSAGWNLQFFNGSYNNFTSKIQANCWTHVVLQRNGSTLRSFVNGVVDATTFTISGTITGGSSTISINNIKDSSLGGTGNVGYTSNLRIVNGTAVYATTGFTPPTAPVTAIANTSLLLNYTNAGIYDAAAQNNGITAGSAQASTTQAKWSPTSMKFNGTTDYLYINSPSGSQLDLSVGQQNWTIECWIYFQGSAGVVFGRAGTSGSTNPQYWLYISADGSAQILINSLTYNLAAGTFASNAWSYFALCRKTTQIRAWVNGTAQTVQTAPTMSSPGSQTFYLGARLDPTAASFFTGYIQDFRITAGIARYDPASSAAISSPTYAFQTR